MWRIVVAPYTDDNGKLVLQTKGDNNNAVDPVIRADSVESVFLNKVGILTKMYEIFLSPWGLIIFIALLLLVFFDELINVVRIATGNDIEEEESVDEIIERIQREDREKQLEEAKRKRDETTKD